MRQSHDAVCCAEAGGKVEGCICRRDDLFDIPIEREQQGLCSESLHRFLRSGLAGRIHA